MSSTRTRSSTAAASMASVRADFQRQMEAAQKQHELEIARLKQELEKAQKGEGSGIQRPTVGETRNGLIESDTEDEESTNANSGRVSKSVTRKRRIITSESGSDSEGESASKKRSSQFASALEKVSAVVMQLKEQAPLLVKSKKKKKSKKGEKSDSKKKSENEDSTPKRKRAQTEEVEERETEQSIKRPRLQVTFDPRQRSDDNTIQIQLDGDEEDDGDTVCLTAPTHDVDLDLEITEPPQLVAELKIKMSKNLQNLTFSISALPPEVNFHM